MKTIDAAGMHFKELNSMIRRDDRKEITVYNCIGQRYIGTALKTGSVTVEGTPGNALGAYLDGGRILVKGNCQDAVGDTMNDGEIVIHGNAGDALGYAMRGGKIFVRGNSGYRTGVHMKEYKEKKPVIIVGGTTGSFLGEYQAGGVIIVLNLNGEKVCTGNFTGTGMHGGKIFLRTESDSSLPELPPQASVRESTEDELAEIRSDLERFCSLFGIAGEKLFSGTFHTITPNAKNPYTRLYTAD
ncbi:MAG: glutamate synthase [Spirochaetia bacterium]|nr:glutamate synthase [Spirochaetia bacterium]